MDFRVYVTLLDCIQVVCTLKSPLIIGDLPLRMTSSPVHTELCKRISAYGWLGGRGDSMSNRSSPNSFALAFDIGGNGTV